VARRLQAALQDLRSYAPPDRRTVLQQQLELLTEETTESFDNDADIEMALLADPGGLGAVDSSPSNPDISATRSGTHGQPGTLGVSPHGRTNNDRTPRTPAREQYWHHTFRLLGL